MEPSALYQKLIAAARATLPDERVPLAFEQRIMARLAGKTAPDAWTLWGQAMGRAAVFSLVLMLLLGAASFFRRPSPKPGPLAQDVEQTLIAAVESAPDQAGEVQ